MTENDQKFKNLFVALFEFANCEIPILPKKSHTVATYIGQKRNSIKHQKKNNNYGADTTKTLVFL